MDDAQRVAAAPSSAGSATAAASCVKEETARVTARAARNKEHSPRPCGRGGSVPSRPDAVRPPLYGDSLS
jgi:hypothetical protein